jgi:hypothetical protein
VILAVGALLDGERQQAQSLLQASYKSLDRMSRWAAQIRIPKFLRASNARLMASTLLQWASQCCLQRAKSRKTFKLWNVYACTRSFQRKRTDRCARRHQFRSLCKLLGSWRAYVLKHRVPTRVCSWIMRNKVYNMCVISIETWVRTVKTRFKLQ